METLIKQTMKDMFGKERLKEKYRFSLCSFKQGFSTCALQELKILQHLHVDALCSKSHPNIMKPLAIVLETDIIERSSDSIMAL